MKVWWVLAYHGYYPDAGLGNVHSTHATYDEAKVVADGLQTHEYRYDYIEIENISEMLGLATESSQEGY